MRSVSEDYIDYEGNCILFESIIGLSLPLLLLHSRDCLLHLSHFLLHLLVIYDVVFVLLSDLTIESEGFQVQGSVAEDGVATLPILEVLPI